ncbi:hypothetical protein PAPYR_2161 [Paratrimastix pyriformis]|uniref:Ubiquitin-like domain-containing protein n=1 Tax=Paratrimastix pyriformis TaxID=342808 RepID=A0ABQ8UXT8_9EUKA|nr:hypothetical protein PAPYR_2161 [Paratrimastix pyriformis]|eukprot:GAFH01001013.1.p1 GENE.GAFH01001013.1~~GAFH01001013.1.p1  ORF type:complete len:595 (-),score=193.83 GAFH01001013.1:301-2085(-)
MQVLVHLTGLEESIAMDFEPNETVEVAKEKINARFSELGFELDTWDVNGLRLLSGASSNDLHELENSRTLAELGVDGSSMLIALPPRPIEFVVDTPDVLVTVWMSLAQRVSLLKKRIGEKQPQLDPEEFHITFANTTLPDDAILRDYLPAHTPRVNLTLVPCLSSFIDFLCDALPRAITLDRNASFEDLWAEVCTVDHRFHHRAEALLWEGRPIPREGPLSSLPFPHGTTLTLYKQTITVLTDSPETDGISVAFRPTSPITDILRQLCGTADRFILSWGNEILNRDGTLASNHIPNEAVLRLVPIIFPLKVTTPQGTLTMTLPVTAAETVAAIKRRLCMFCERPPRRQILTIMGVPLADDEFVLKRVLGEAAGPGASPPSAMGTPAATPAAQPPPSQPAVVWDYLPGDCLDLTIEMNGATKLILRVRIRDAMADVKQRLWQVAGIPVDQQRLTWRDMPLEDETTVAETELMREPVPTLKVTIQSHLTVAVAGDLPDGQGHLSLEVQAPRNETVWSLKCTIARTCGLRPEKQRLMAEGRAAEDGRRLEDYYTCGWGALEFALQVIPGVQVIPSPSPLLHRPGGRLAALEASSPRL